MRGNLMKRLGLAVVAIAAVAMNAHASPQASTPTSSPESPMAARAPGMVKMDACLSARFVERFPHLGKLNGFGDITLPEVPDEVAKRVSTSRKITLVVYPTERRPAIANNYLLYTVPCDEDAARSCHYLGVMTQFGMPIQRMYGPLDLDVKPALVSKLSGA